MSIDAASPLARFWREPGGQIGVLSPMGVAAVNRHQIEDQDIISGQAFLTGAI
jgi:hypothetical protein